MKGLEGHGTRFPLGRCSPLDGHVGYREKIVECDPKGLAEFVLHECTCETLVAILEMDLKCVWRLRLVSPHRSHLRYAAVFILATTSLLDFRRCLTL